MAAPDHIRETERTAHTVLEMRGITKHFPGLIALDSVDFSVDTGEIHALLGQNGAGKSTLMKILAGVYPVESGELRVDGRSVHYNHPRDALQMGIGTVYQDLSLVPHLTVAQNISLGRESGSALVINDGQDLERASAILARLGVKEIDIRRRVMDLPLAQQQLVEIAKVLSYNPRILVLDEPTAALAEEETTLLFRILKGLKAQNIAIIFISHRFKEVLEHCDRATVLRNGRLVKTIDLRGVTEQELIELTIGERIEDFYHRGEAASRDNRSVDPTPVIEAEHFSVGRAVRDVSFALRRGEILGITGLLGAGQNELARALFGIQPEVSGVLKRKGAPVLITSPKQAIRLGIGLLTEQRKREGLVLEMNVRENITLPSIRRFQAALMFIRNRRERAEAQRFADQLRIKAPSMQRKVNTLSGGNQQKVILAKWLLRDLDVLIFIAPTQGIDVGAKAEIYQQLGQLAAEGKSIIVVSEDLIEILGISDRILAMHQGRIVGEFMRQDATEERLLAAIQGNRT